MTFEQNQETPEFVAEHELRVGALSTPVRVRISRRKSDGALLVEQSLKRDIFAPALYVFSNARRDRIRILYWERNGLVLWSKRLEHDAAELKHFKHQWARYSKAFLSAVDYLRQRFPIHAAEMLPSINMLSTLSVFFHQHAGQPNKFQACEIRKWFWATGVGKRYSGGGYHKNIVSDSTFFQSLAEGKRRFFTFKDFVDPVLELQGEEYNSGSARTRAFFCLLAAHKPLYLDDGQPIPLDDNIAYIGNRKHRHHIFPQAQLRPHFHPRFYNSLCNVCFLVSRDNLIVGSKLPRNYLAVYRDEGHALFNKVMKSHLIPFGEESGVWQNSVKQGFKEFRAQRLALICKAFEKQAGIKLFRSS